MEILNLHTRALFSENISAEKHSQSLQLDYVGWNFCEETK